MRAAVVHRHGGAPTYEDRADPAPKENHSLVRVSAAPIVPLDLLCASGTSYFGPPALPYVPGVQGVGTVLTGDALPAGVRVWFATPAGMAPGDGSMAERCLVADADLVQIDTSLDDEQVAAVGLSGVAAWMALTWRAGLRIGEKVVVLGATGAVGQAAVAAARHLGAGGVVAVCRRPNAEADLLAAGATAVVSIGSGADPADTVADVSTDDGAAASARPVDPAGLATRIQDAAGGPVQVVIDPVFGRVAAGAALALGPGGRLVNIGGTAGDTAEFSSAVLRGRSIAILGYTNNALSPTQRADALRSILDVLAAIPALVRARHFSGDACTAAWQQAGTGGSRVVLDFS